MASSHFWISFIKGIKKAAECKPGESGGTKEE
jgi:hypothetical protein